MYHPSRGGVRGGRDQFNWDDIKGDKHRENYLGHSIKAPVGRWQKGKDLHWYTRDKHSDEEAAARDEIRRLKEEEEEAMQEMLGLAPKKSRRQIGQLDAREISEVLKKVKDGEESAPSYAAGERVEGLGFAPVRGQITHGLPGRGQAGPANSERVSYEKVPAVSTGQGIQEFSGNEVERDPTNDHLALGETRIPIRPESVDQTSSSNSEEEGVSDMENSRKRKSGKQREGKRTVHKTRKKSKSRESDQEVNLHSHPEERRESRRQARRSSEESERKRGYTARRHSRHIKDLHSKEYLPKEVRGSEGSPEETTLKTPAVPNQQIRKDSRAYHDRNGKLRHDTDSDEEAERRKGPIHSKDQFRKDHFSRDIRDGSFNARHDREGSEGNLQATAIRTSFLPSSQLRRESRSHNNSNGRRRHDSDSDQEQERTRGFRHIDHRSNKDHMSRDKHDVSFTAGHDRKGGEGSLQGTTRRAFAHPSSQFKREVRSHHSRQVWHSDNDKESEGRRDNVRQVRQDSASDNEREERREGIRQRRHDSGSDEEKEGIRGDRLQRRHASDKERQGRSSIARQRHHSDEDMEKEGRGREVLQRRHYRNSDKEREKRGVDALQRRRYGDRDEERKGRGSDAQQRRNYGNSDKEMEGRGGDARQRRHDSDSDKEKEGRRSDRLQGRSVVSRKRRHDSESDKEKELRNDARQGRHDSDSDNEREGRIGEARQRSSTGHKDGKVGLRFNSG